MRINLLKHFFFMTLLLLPVMPLAAQNATPKVEIVLSSDQAQQGDTIYADVVIRNGQAVAGADIGISTDSCLQVIEREPGNYLPSTGENGGFSPAAELSDSGTRFAASVTNRSRIANGDGTFFRATLKVTCDTGTPTVRVTFAQLAALADPNSVSNELLGYSLEQGNLSVVNGNLTVHQGAVVSTPAPIGSITLPATTIPVNLPLYLALALVVVSGAGMIVFVIIFYRRLRNNQK
jgi:hypothetical protein